MKISIAMATYNGASYLHEQLASFSSQTHLPDELVVTDDNSSDDTIEILKEFAASAPFDVKIFQNPENLGFGQNFGRALSLCQGDLVFMADQDDVWFPKKLQKMVHLANNNPTFSCFMNDALLADGMLQPNGQTKFGQIRELGLGDHTFVMGCCVAIRQSLLKIALPIPPGFPHDSWIVPLAENLEQVLRVHAPLQLYRLHGGNTSYFFVNSAQKMTKLQSWKHKMTSGWRRFTQPSGLERETVFQSALVQRLQKSETACLALIGAPKWQSLLPNICTKTVELETRARIRALPRLQRIVPIIKQFRTSTYPTATAAIKDLVQAKVSLE